MGMAPSVSGNRTCAFSLKLGLLVDSKNSIIFRNFELPQYLKTWIKDGIDKTIGSNHRSKRLGCDHLYGVYRCVWIAPGILLFHITA